MSIKRVVAVLIFILVLAAGAWAGWPCPMHPASQCNTDGQVKYLNGQRWEHYRCAPCGDSGWKQN